MDMFFNGNDVVQSRNLFEAAKQIAEKYHTGFRKDKVTKEIQHQYDILSNFEKIAENLKILEYEYHLIRAAIMLHDVQEDYFVSDTDLRKMLGPDSFYKDLLMDSVKALNKHDKDLYPNGYDKISYYREIGKLYIAAIVKVLDRDHNLSTMRNVFTLKHQQKYIDEARDYILPLLKEWAEDQHIGNMTFNKDDVAYAVMKFLEKRVTEAQDYIDYMNKANIAFDIEDE